MSIEGLHVYSSSRRRVLRLESFKAPGGRDDHEPAYTGEPCLTPSGLLYEYCLVEVPERGQCAPSSTGMLSHDCLNTMTLQICFMNPPAASFRPVVDCAIHLFVS